MLNATRLKITSTALLLSYSIATSTFSAEPGETQKAADEAKASPSVTSQIYGPDSKALVPSPKIISEKAELALSRNKCLMARPAFGDLGNNWSVGMTTAVQAVKYTFKTKQASTAASAGGGIAFRYYGKSEIGTEEAAKNLGFTDDDLKAIKSLDKGSYYNRDSGTYSLPVNKISTACRATTSDIGKDRTEKLASSIFSITPTVFGSKQSNEGDISFQPALLVGFLDDIISIGPGYNLTGPEKGKVFMVVSVGYGFKF